MKKICVLVIALGLLGLSGCSDDPTEPVSGAITGQVLDGDGQPVAGAALLVEYEMPVFPADKPMTQVKFEIPKPGAARLWITESCSGETIRVLMDDTVDAGTHAVTWDGTDTAGLIVTSGVYIYHLEFDGEIITRDLVLFHGGYAAEADPDHYRHHAVSGADGRFRFVQDCLPFGHTSEGTDELGNPTGTFTISRRVNIYALHADRPTGQSGWVTVDETAGVDVTVTLSD